MRANVNVSVRLYTVEQLTHDSETRCAGVGGAAVSPDSAGVDTGVGARHVVEHQGEVIGEPQVTGQPRTTLCRENRQSDQLGSYNTETSCCWNASQDLCGSGQQRLMGNKQQTTQDSLGLYIWLRLIASLYDMINMPLADYIARSEHVM